MSQKTRCDCMGAPNSPQVRYAAGNAGIIQLYARSTHIINKRVIRTRSNDNQTRKV